MFKRFRFVLTVSAALLLLLLFSVSVSAANVTASGFCGNDTSYPYDSTSAAYQNLTWTLYDDGALVIEGDGAMKDYASGKAPWKSANPTSLTLEGNITNIGNYAFYKLSSIRCPLVLPDSVTAIGKYAFYNCYGLNGPLVLPSHLATVGNYAFYFCDGLDGSLTIPDTVTSIGSYGFYACIGLDGLTLGENVTSIGSYAFNNCAYMTGALVIPDSVETIGAYAFDSCYGFDAALIIGESVTSIGNSAFAYTNMTDIYFRGNAPSLAVSTSTLNRSFMTDVTLYYLPEKSGWTDSVNYNADNGTYKGYALSVWEDLPSDDANIEPPVQTYAISGVLSSSNPSMYAHLTLMADNAIVAELTFPNDADAFNALQSFTFEGLEPGVYTLVASKPGHRAVTLSNLTVADADLDVSRVVLRPGDLNGDGFIDGLDVSVIATYLMRSVNDSNRHCDMNGDGFIDSLDVMILMSNMMS